MNQNPRIQWEGQYPPPMLKIEMDKLTISISWGNELNELSVVI